MKIKKIKCKILEKHPATVEVFMRCNFLAWVALPHIMRRWNKVLKAYGIDVNVKWWKS